MNRRLVTLAALLPLAVAGCAVPVSMNHPLGTAYVELWNDKHPDGSETCHAKASGGMEAKGLDLSASLCHGGDSLVGRADDLSGLAAQQAALGAWERLNEAQQQQALAAGKAALKVGGPLACVAVLTALGVPAAAPLCAALAGVAVPAPPVPVP